MKSGGAALGGLLGGPAGATVGGLAGSLVSKVTGMGEYKIEENSLLAGNVPQFRNGARSVRIAHRDFLGDVTGSTAFAIKSYPLNPGLNLTFPWLAGVAGQFQSYRIRGMIFEFKSTSAQALNNINSALGTVIMATQYNSLLASFSSKLEMENYEFATSCKPSESMLHPVECAQGEAPLECLYIRTGSVPNGQDERFFDFGDFQIATVGMQAASTIGELWVTYDIELYKPRLYPGGTIPGQFTRINNGGWDANNTLGVLQTTPKGNLGITITATGAGWDSITWPSSISAGKFSIIVSWKGSAATNIVVPTTTLTNLSLVSDWRNSTATNLNGPAGGTNNTNSMTMVFEVTVSGYSATGSKVQFTAGTFPGGSADYVDMLIVSIPQSDVFV